MYYTKCKTLMNNYGFKTIYKERCNSVMKSKGLELNHWIKHNNGLFGLVDKFGRWCWRNTINTHPYCFLYLYNFLIELGYDDIDFEDESKWEENINLFWDLIELKWELFFTDNIETKYYHKLMLRTNKSWSVGQITTIAFLFVYREIFDGYEFKKLSYSFDRGDLDDFIGIDVTIVTKDDLVITVQIKNGKFVERNSSYSVMSSVNDLKSRANHYCFVDIQENETKIVVFKNEIEKIERYGETYLFSKELLINKEISKNMQIPQTLNDILIFCAKNDIVFDLKNNNGEENKMEWAIEPEKIVTITIGDFKDENLSNYLADQFIELQKLFN